MSKIKLTPKQLIGIAFLIVGTIFFLYVAVNAILLANGTIPPIKVEFANSSGYEEFAGILLQIGLFLVLVAIGYAFARIGLNITKE
jgi:hypothetical protein